MEIAQGEARHPISFIVLALAMTGLAGWRFAEAGWPFSRGKPLLIIGAGLLFLVAYPVKAWGWRTAVRRR